MPVPIAVWRCSSRRSIAPASSSRLRVGACTIAAEPAKETSAMRTSEGCDPTNVFAAACAAAILVGSMSFARIDSDTSIASTIVRWSEGSVTRAPGRAAATISAVIASSSRTGGTWRRQPGEATIASRTTARLPKRSADFLRRRCSHR